ncbi:hypothetical protein BXT86_03715 [candidate division WOR-3 bacterium 4484_100]|uniref:D-alanine--D-alanine ligase n=1 Tax=candidate division WOR-3 bacterium 4484_100 TaxID=1936077 RepID=A0A1V4QG45_UNCW3|nr:MAG: hypothetical protein BXT86_03715 [candidate division WOR-3 bacterium 4484_100]
MDRLKRYLHKKVIGVLYGGWSSEREVSINSGRCVLSSLKKQGFKVRGIDLDKNFIRKLKNIDLVFIALHGKPGEDGTVQGILDFYGIPYTGSGVTGSAIGMDKIVTKSLLVAHRIPTPPFYYNKNINPEQIIKALGLPVVIKPCAEGSSVGVSIVSTKKALKQMIKKTLRKFPDIFFEKYIPGMMATCGILNESALPVLEICPKKKFYDYRSKYTEGMTEYIVPARIPKKKYRLLQKYALQVHQTTRAYGFSRVDFVLDKDYNPYALEINTIPGLLYGSNLPLEAKAAGLNYDQLILEILKTALKRPGT